VLAVTVAGRLATVGGGGGKEEASTRGTGAALGCTEPVTSFGELLNANGLLNRVASELHPAVPIAITAKATARGHDRERNNATTEDMVDSLVHNRLSDELTPWG
jgi:hypothetical protein